MAPSGLEKLEEAVRSHAPTYVVRNTFIDVDEGDSSAAARARSWPPTGARADRDGDALAAQVRLLGGPCGPPSESFPAQDTDTCSVVGCGAPSEKETACPCSDADSLSDRARLSGSEFSSSASSCLEAPSEELQAHALGQCKQFLRQLPKKTLGIRSDVVRDGGVASAHQRNLPWRDGEAASAAASHVACTGPPSGLLGATVAAGPPAGFAAAPGQWQHRYYWQAGVKREQGFCDAALPARSPPAAWSDGSAMATAIPDGAHFASTEFADGAQFASTGLASAHVEEGPLGRQRAGRRTRAKVDAVAGKWSPGPLALHAACQLRPVIASPSFGALHGFHSDVRFTGSASEDLRACTKDCFQGRLSVLSENSVVSGGRHDYVVCFSEGELSTADGVGFVFSGALPCTKNIQKIISVFVNQRGRICVRVYTDVVVCSKGVGPLGLGDLIGMTIDLDERVASFTVWPRNGSAPSCVELPYGFVLDSYLDPSRPRSPSQQGTCGHLACVVKNLGVTAMILS